MKKPESARELRTWCVEGHEKVLQLIDTAFDRLDVDKPETQSILKEATEILNEIEELEKELDELLK
jgi:hypothetical protein